MEHGTLEISTPMLRMCIIVLLAIGPRNFKGKAC